MALSLFYSQFVAGLNTKLQAGETIVDRILESGFEPVFSFHLVEDHLASTPGGADYEPHCQRFFERSAGTTQFALGKHLCAASTIDAVACGELSLMLDGVFTHKYLTNSRMATATWFLVECFAVGVGVSLDVSM